jgi:hypothetical protein
VVIDNRKRNRSLRKSRARVTPLINTDRYGLLNALRAYRLTSVSSRAYTRPVTLQRDLLKTLLEGINSDSRTQRDERVRRVEQEVEENRRKAIEGLRKAWPEMGGSEKDLDILTAALENTVFDTTTKTTRRNGQPVSSQGRTIPMKEIQKQTYGFIDQASYTDIVTQTEIREQIMRQYPDAKLSSVRSAVSHFLSDLEKQGRVGLIEKGQGGSPHKYRKKKMEGSLLDLLDS